MSNENIKEFIKEEISFYKKLLNETNTKTLILTVETYRNWFKDYNLCKECWCEEAPEIIFEENGINIDASMQYREVVLTLQ